MTTFTTTALHTDPAIQARAYGATQTLLERLDAAQAVLLATVDGFPIAHAQRRDTDADRLAAIVSSIGALGDAASREAGIGDPRCLVVEATLGRLVLRRVVMEGRPMVVAVLTDASVVLGVVWAALREVEQLLEAA